MPSTELTITGMTCGDRVMAITQSLHGVAGVMAVDASLEQGLALVSGTAAPDVLIGAIEQEGYHGLQAS